MDTGIGTALWIGITTGTTGAGTSTGIAAGIGTGTGIATVIASAGRRAPLCLIAGLLPWKSGLSLVEGPLFVVVEGLTGATASVSRQAGGSKRRPGQERLEKCLAFAILVRRFFAGDRN